MTLMEGKLFRMLEEAGKQAIALQTQLFDTYLTELFIAICLFSWGPFSGNTFTTLSQLHRVSSSAFPLQVGGIRIQT